MLYVNNALLIQNESRFEFGDIRTDVISFKFKNSHRLHQIGVKRFLRNNERLLNYLTQI